MWSGSGCIFSFIIEGDSILTIILVLEMSSLLRMFSISVLIRLVLIGVSYITNEYSEGYRSVASIEGGFNSIDGQWQEGSRLNFGWIIVLFVLFDVELAMLVTLLFAGTQLLDLLILVLILFGRILVEWGIHSLNW